MSAFRTRFAPSPTGPLHLGHALSALTAWDMSQEAEGTFLLRIEDIDKARSKAEWEALIFEDLHWLGLRWPEPVMRQSDRLETYAQAIGRLHTMGLAYACTCTRRDIQDALSAPQEGVVRTGPDGPVYPGTCRGKSASGSVGDVHLRLNMDAALAWIFAAHKDLDALMFAETGAGPGGKNGEIFLDADDLISTVGDIVLARKDFGTSYHLSVVLDDAAQDITHVVRGQDLFEATKIHVVLQSLLDLPRPVYHHHDLIRDDTGKRLAKRDDARAIRLFREEGETPDTLRDRLGLSAG